MDDEQPPPLPPRAYKSRRKSAKNDDDTKSMWKPPKLQLHGGSGNTWKPPPPVQLQGDGSGGGHVNTNHNVNRLNNDFENLTLSRASVSNDSYFKSYSINSDALNRFIDEGKKININNGTTDFFQKQYTVNKSITVNENRENNEVNQTKPKPNPEPNPKPLIDNLIAKNIDEFFKINDEKEDVFETMEPHLPMSSDVIIKPWSDPEKSPLKYSASVPTNTPPLPPRRNHAKTLPASIEVSRENKTKSDVFKNLFDKVVETNEDIIDFGIAITDLRRTFKHGDTATNSGLIVPYIVKNSLPYSSVNVSIYLESNKDDENIMRCDYSWTAKEICSHFFSTFCTGLNTLDLFLYGNKYLLRMVGFDMYLHENIPLCDHSHIQEHAKQGKSIKLDLVNKSCVHTNKNLSRTHKDDLMLDACHINFEYFFEKPDLISVSEQGLTILLETFDKEVEALKTTILEHPSNIAEGHFVPDRMIQVAKAISTVLATIDIPQIQNAVQLLESLTCRHANEEADTASEMCTSENFQQHVSPADGNTNEGFDKSVCDLGVQQLTYGLYYLVELYCKSFELKFNLADKKLLPDLYTGDIYQQVDKKDTDNIFERVDPRTISDNFVMKIVSVHRIPSEWKFNFVGFQLDVGLYYGGNLLCPIVKCTKSTVNKGFFEHISFANPKLIEFDISVREIPRETKIGFVLWGVISPVNITSLCWFTCNMYDYHGFLISGSLLVGLLHDLEFDPVATCATSYIHQCDTVILQVNFQIYPIEVMFPQPMLFLSSDDPQKKEMHSSDLNHIHKILRKDAKYLSEIEKNLIWNNKFSLSGFPNALVYVLCSVPLWDAETVLLVHNMLNYWKMLNPHDALKLLEGNFPDKIIRGHAVLCLNAISDDEFFEYLPGLVQALKYEAYHNSQLALFLIKRALCSVRLCHYLYWYIKYYTNDAQFCQRYKTILSGLLHVCGQRLRREFVKQDTLVNGLIKTANLVKEVKDVHRKPRLEDSLDNLNEELDAPFCLPIDPAIKVKKIIANESSYFNSFTIPLKVAFANSDPLGEDVSVIFKSGDDLRKDLLTIQMFRVMNTLWLNNSLDLKIVLYNVLPTGLCTGFIEIVPNSTTLREIHIQYGGVTGSFKQESLSLWLQQFNTTKDLYQNAIDNFTASAAGYCVATYVLGIGDRHNDNIMITKNGHMFHIDFSKYMGNIQKFGNIKRDRVPFVLTPDMAYIINNGVSPSQNFQIFIEYCCKAFNILRSNHDKLLSVLSLMMYADIAYVSTRADIEYVHQSLQLQLSDEEAEVYFSQLIQNSLSSVSTQLNFFIHNVAHMKDCCDNIHKKTHRTAVFTFSQETHSFGSCAGVFSARVVDFQKRYVPGKHYMFVINILETEESCPNFVFRRYEDFQELHTNVYNNFDVLDIELPQLLQKFVIGRSEVREVAQERRLELDKYLHDLSRIPVIWSSEVMATFLHSYIRDHEEQQRFNESIVYLQQGWKSRIGGKVKLSMVYERRYFKVYIMHVCDLVPRRIQGLADSYVKTYLLPDFMKHTKRRTKICHKSLNPTFNETFEYNVPFELLKNRTLEVTVWDRVNITDKEFLGGFKYYLSEFNPQNTTGGWFNIVDIELDR